MVADGEQAYITGMRQMHYKAEIRLLNAYAQVGDGSGPICEFEPLAA